MTVITTNTPAPIGGVTFDHTARLIKRVTSSVSKWLRARATFKALANLSDEDLNDIGLFRGAINSAAWNSARP